MCGRDVIYFLKDVINDLLGKEEDDTMVKAIEDKVRKILRNPFRIIPISYNFNI